MTPSPSVQESYTRGPSDVPMLEQTLAQNLDDAARCSGARPAVVECGPDGDPATGRSWTYEQLREESVTVAKALMAAGYEPGDRIGLWSPNVAEWTSLLYGAALRVTGRPAEAEEVAQEAMLRAWRDAARFDPRKAKLSTWLYRIAVNLAIDRARRPGEHRGGVPLEEAWLQADPSPDPEAALAARQDRAAVAAALRELPPRQRAALALAYDRGLSGAEAAAALDVTQRALEGLLRRGRLFLLARLRRGKE